MHDEEKGGEGLQLWGGLECTVNRVGERYLDQFDKGGHRDRPEDLDLVAGLGIRTLRYPLLWERTAPERPDLRDWSFADDRMGRLRALGIEPIVGLVHHGGGPRYTSLVDEGFAGGLAAHARAVAERYPWVDAYTPVNEPLTTARFSGLYGHWYPHGTDGPTYARALLNQVRATVLSMAAIRSANLRARLVQTEDLGKTHATEPLLYQAEFENERRWATWDLLCGRVDRDHRMWGALLHDGIGEGELEWLLENPCPPDVVGINHYLTSERFLDHRVDRYPPHTHGHNGREGYADVEAVRVLALGVDGIGALMSDAWERYRLPVAVTECHLGCTREEQGRWLLGTWRAAEEARTEGADVRAVAVWSMFGAHDWGSLLTRDEGLYEPGVFDLRAPEPRPTALAPLVRGLATGGAAVPEAFEGDGWWERPVRLLYEPALASPTASAAPRKESRHTRRPLLVVGARGTLGQAFSWACELRGLEVRLVGRDEMDLADPRAVARGLARHRPWAVVNAAGSADPEGAERDAARCWRDNAAGPGILATACADLRLPLVGFSSGLVFDGAKDGPYVESDATGPLGTYGKAKARAEASVLRAHPGALVVRTGQLFGPGGRGPALIGMVDALTKGRPFFADGDAVVSPTFVPDLVHAALDLLLDGTTGIVHLANEGQATWAGFARRVAAAAGLDPAWVRSRPVATLGGRALLPANSTLASERMWTMPTLEDALARFGGGLDTTAERDLDPVGYLS